MNIINQKKSPLLLLLALFFILHSTTHALPTTSIKAIFWSKPTLFNQSRMGMVKHLGWFTSIFNAGRALDIQEELFEKLSKTFGVQTQQYKANDPETNKPLPLIMREWLTGEKLPHSIKKDIATAPLFKKDGFIRKITDIIFTPKYMIEATYVVEDSLKLVKRINPDIIQVLASNYDPASYEELKKSSIGKRVLPLFKHVYNSGTLKPPYQGMVLQDPAFFTLIMAELHLKPEECLVITSDPSVRDAAHSLGMQTVFHPYGDCGSIKKHLKQLYII